VPGGDEREGVLNKIDVGALAADGYHPYSDSSYIQAVGFSDAGPHALGLLIYGQSSDPRSPFHFDQMAAAFSNAQLAPLPFSPADVAAQTRSVLRLSEQADGKLPMTIELMETDADAPHAIELIGELPERLNAITG
jgi:acyl-homoserine lactone acylase PvdQ